MAISPVPQRPLVRSIYEEVGNALRSVGRHTESGYDLVYIRDDVEAIYSTDEIDEVFDDLKLQALNRDYVEGLFNAGTLECTIFGFESAIMFHFVDEDQTGLWVTVDRSAPITLDSIIASCQTEL